MTRMFADVEIDPDINREALTSVTVKMTVNTDTYGRVEYIMREIEDSLEWMAYDHDAILTATWEVDQ